MRSWGICNEVLDCGDHRDRHHGRAVCDCGGSQLIFIDGRPIFEETWHLTTEDDIPYLGSSRSSRKSYHVDIQGPWPNQLVAKMHMMGNVKIVLFADKQMIWGEGHVVSKSSTMERWFLQVRMFDELRIKET